LFLTNPAHALDSPKDKVILSISGSINLKNTGAQADFDMAMLAALPQHSFTTKTPWYAEPKKFTGPLLRDVLAAVGAQGKMLKAVALNNFKVEIPVEDAQQLEVIVALLMNDQPMAIRDKGPLFVIYPFETNIELQSTRYYSRSIWQLRALEVQ
jgi:hypothetical protein